MTPIVIIEFIVLILSLIAAGFSASTSWKNVPFYLNVTIAALMLLALLGKL